MTTMTDRPTYTPVYENGTRKQIQGMAASSISKKWYQVSQCSRCNQYVAWAQSSKTGKWYVCDTAQYSTEGGYPRFRAVPYSYHQCKEVDYEGYAGRSDEQRAMGDD